MFEGAMTSDIVSFCPDCNDYRPCSMFSRNKNNDNGLDTYCRMHKVLRARKSYMRNRNSVLRRNREYRAAHPEKVRDQWRRYRAKHPKLAKIQSHKGTMRRCGITTDRYNEILQSQGGKCAICGKPQGTMPRNLSLDHDHRCCLKRKTCGKCVRGLLCNNCNQGLGRFMDSPVILHQAIQYLEKFSGRHVVGPCIDK